ncbi:hypothetical protein [Winogradskyella sp.]|uniref:hypothetical protein n=1 Tax=Winogradskyella sp. TaxID=1883156 RepID=UPI0026023F21|nr:hypothetical protein [Winogradskyella sp.]
MKRTLIIITLLLASCSSDDANNPEVDNSLSSYIEGRSFEVGAVIACSGNDVVNPNNVEVYFFPESNSENFKLFQTNSSNLDPNDFSNYDLLVIDDEPFFNGTLRKYVGFFDSERWFIVSYEIDGDIKLSNPIRIKQMTQPTLFSEDILVNQEQSQMPIFSWDINSETDNAIFFQVVSTVDDDLISGTYTFENQFQYYNTSNVVLNITVGTPPDLVLGQTYKFTVMDVSEDNWVNQLLVTQFTVE